MIALQKSSDLPVITGNIAAASKHTSHKKQKGGVKTPSLSPIAFQTTFKKLPADVKVKLDNLNKGGDTDKEDIKLILLVILAIFIPPLAVYLKNESIDKWFWITLILCLLSFTAFFFIFGGAFWLIAVIIALLYVFDAIK